MSIKHIFHTNEVQHSLTQNEFRSVITVRVDVVIEFEHLPLLTYLDKNRFRRSYLALMVIRKTPINMDEVSLPEVSIKAVIIML